MMKRIWIVFAGAMLGCSIAQAQSNVITVTGANNVQDGWTGTQGTSDLGTLSLPVAIQNNVADTGVLAYTISGLDINGVGGNNDSVNINFNVAAERSLIVTSNGSGSYLSDSSTISQSDESLLFTFASLSVNLDGGTGNGFGTFDGFSEVTLGAFKSSSGDSADVNGATITATQDTGTQAVSLADVSSIDVGWVAGNGLRVTSFDFQVTATADVPTTTINITGANNVQTNWSGTQGTSSLGTLSLPVAISNQVSGTGVLTYVIDGLDINGVGGNDDSVEITLELASHFGNIVTSMGVGSYLSSGGSFIADAGSGLTFDFSSMSVNIDGGTDNGAGTFDGFSAVNLKSFKSSSGDQAHVNGNTVTANQDTGDQSVALSNATLVVVGWVAGDGVRVGSVDFQVTVSVYVPSAYELWAAGYALSGNDALLGVDTEPDGLNNLMEYALGGNPTNADAATIQPSYHILASGVSNGFYYVHNERTDDPDLVYTVLLSSNLVSSAWKTNGTERVGETALSNGWKTVTHRAAISNDAAFMGLRVKQQSGPVGPGDWNRVRLYGQAYNITSGEPSGWEERHLETIADNFQLFCVEKRHARDYWGDITSEQATRYASRVFHDWNPNVDVLLYWNAMLPYESAYESSAAVLTNGYDYFEEQHATNWPGDYQWKFSNPDAVDYWVDVANYNVGLPPSLSQIDGVFVDAVNKAENAGYTEQIKAAMAALDGLVIYNGFWVNETNISGGAEYLDYTDGVFVESFLKFPCDTEAEERLLIDTLLEVDPDKYIICKSNGELFDPEHQQHFVHRLAAYLIVANDFTYFNYATGYSVDAVESVNTYPEYTYAVGAPLGDAVKYSDRYERVFEHCTAVWYPGNDAASSITWGQDNE